MTGTSVIVAADGDAIAERALDLLVSQLAWAIAHRGVAHLALTGGSSAAALYARFATDARAGRVEWARVHVWQGDERFVPTDHEHSNWGVALDDWLEIDGTPTVPVGQRHPMVEATIAAGGTPDEAAVAYARAIDAALPRRRGLPAFDVILLGVGGDGHILSVFPESQALARVTPTATAVPAPTHIEPPEARVTLAPSLLAAAGLILLMAPGGGKADVIARILSARASDATRLPAILARRPNAVWLLEPDSAARLGSPAR